MVKQLVSFASLLFSYTVFTAQIETNQLRVQNAPPWLKEARLQKVTETAQNFLEWEIKRMNVYFHASDVDYNSGQNLNFLSDAYFRSKDCTIHLSPRVNDGNFDRIFGHELVHAIFFQKYKGVIPLWLEEGLANYIGKTASVDYQWLSNQPLMADITQLKHPNSTSQGAKYHYSLSTAVIEMIASHCSLPELLRLSVGKKVEIYLKTYCEINDINAMLKSWIKKNASRPVSEKTGLDANSVPWWKKRKQSDMTQ